MKRILSLLPVFALAITPAVLVAEQLIPAGSTVTCRVAEGKISSKTTAIGDPVLCTLDPVEKYGRSVFPFGSYLEGTFEDYKDPGHFVGKGWMELKFDRMYVGNHVYPISAKVVQAPKYKVDREGRILGNGHPVRDTVEWLIPVLWPIDLINLPRRGPSPVLLPESKLTLELMDDVGIPDVQEPIRQERAALIERNPPPSAPQQVIYQNFQQAPVQQPPQQVYYPQPQVIYPPQQTVIVQPPAPIYRYVVPRPPAYYAYPPPAYRYYGPGY